MKAQRPPTEQPVITVQKDLGDDKTSCLPSPDRRGAHHLLCQTRSGSVQTPITLSDFTV